MNKTSCKSCTEGHICNDLKLEAEKPCPVNRTCPDNSIGGLRCDPGYHIPSGTHTCDVCPAGRYCWPSANADNGDQGTCGGGYICQGGSEFEKPLISLSTIVAGSTEFDTYNGPAYPGYKSTDGATQDPCPTGEWQPSAFSTTCITCREGYYCPDTGMSSLINYPCDAGYICGTGETTPNPTACSIATYCLSGSVFEQRCPDGYKNDVTAQETCQECGTGYYCYQKGPVGSLTEQVESCPTSNTECSSEILKREPKCQDGYKLDTSTDTCVLCPDTKYCRGGVEAGNCIAGYICDQDAASPISTPNPTNRQCPINHYCVEAATSGTECGEGTFNGNLGAISDQACLPCEPGYTCKKDSNDETQVTACPIGYYCPEYDQSTNTQEDPQECPIYTSSSVQKLFLVEMCSYCPAGYNCNTTAITEYQLHPCPLGYYCLPNALNDLVNTDSEYQSLHKCPNGTYGAKTGLTTENGCNTCPAGSYCDPAISPTEPQTCTAGNYCPEGSELETTCAGGKYCNSTNNYQQSTCPVNYKCESGTGVAIECAAGVICPAGSRRGTKCGKGYEVQTIDGEDTCISCPAGYYNTDAAESCKLCPPGYLCYGPTATDNSVPGTSSATPTDEDADRGEICPAGYYCPEGSSSPTPCPTGKYNEFSGKASEDDCLVCEVNTYNDLTGQTGCQPCGEFATSDSGAITCTCIGAFRTFGKTDSACRCQPRYVYRKEDGTIEDNNVSTEDCIPLTYGRCDSNSEGRYIRDNKCYDSSFDCKPECTNGGTFDITTGKCTCSSTSTTAAEICNSDCISSSSGVSMSTDGTLTFTSSTGTTTTLDFSADSDAIGFSDITCNTEDGCSVTQTTNTNGVPQGTYGSVNYVKNKARRMLGNIELPIPQPKSYWEFEKPHRVLATVDADTATIDNPVVCLENGDTMMFEITNYDNYPVYDENNILNSNKDFDYGPFVDLASQIKAKKLSGLTGSTNPVLFSYTFTEGGTYVFTDATITTNELVIVVANPGETCPDSTANIQTSTARSLTSAGTSQSDEIVLALDIPLLITIIVFLILVLCLIGASVAY